jgi:thioredoxin 1
VDEREEEEKKAKEKKAKEKKAKEKKAREEKAKRKEERKKENKKEILYIIKMPARVIVLTDRNEFKENLGREQVVIVKAFADWCGPCKLIDPYFNEFIEEQLTEKVLVIKLDVDVGFDLASHLKVTSIPQLFYFKNGELQKTVIGGVIKRVEKFLQEIKKEL